MLKKINQYAIVALVALCFIYCENLNEEEDVTSIGGISSPIANGKSLVVTTKDSSSGSLSVIDLEALTVIKNIVDLRSDLVIRNTGNTPIVIERFGGDNIKRISTSNGFTVVDELNLGSGANPHDIVQVDSDFAIVSLYGKDYLAVINLNTFVEDVSKRIDVSAYSDDVNETASEVSGLVKSGNFVYAAMQNLGDASSGFARSNDSKLIKIDISDMNSISTSTFTMPFRNPVSDLQLFDDSGTLKIIFSSVHDYTSDTAGVASFDITGETFASNLLVESDVSGAIALTDVFFVSSTLGFSISYSGYDSTVGDTKNTLIAFNPSATSNKVLSNLLDSEFFQGMLVYDNKLFVGDRTPTKPGIRIFNATTFEEITTEPIDVGLPPNSLLLIDN